MLRLGRWLPGQAHALRQPWPVEQIERRTHTYPPFLVATIAYPSPWIRQTCCKTDNEMSQVSKTF